MFKRILTLSWLMFLVFIFLPSVSMALKGGPDKGGYEFYDSYEKEVAPFEWESLRSYNTISVFKVDAGSAVLAGPVNIGFDFQFYGNTYVKVYISRYGYLTFNDGPIVQFDPRYQPQTIPTDGEKAYLNSADNFIAGMWAQFNSGA